MMDRRQQVDEGTGDSEVTEACAVHNGDRALAGVRSQGENISIFVSRDDHVC